METTNPRCHGCGHFGTRDCTTVAAQVSGDTCASYLSWTELWDREMAAIERAQRVTYIAAAALAVVAIAAIVLPRAFG